MPDIRGSIEALREALDGLPPVVPPARAARDEWGEAIEVEQRWVTADAPRQRVHEMPMIDGQSIMSKRIDQIFPLRDPRQVDLRLFKSWEEVAKTKRRTEPYIFRDPKGLYGIEVEVENVLTIDPNIPLVFWSIEEDGSLRNHGKEFKTHALPAMMLEPALTVLYEGLNNNVSFSKRTSIHVHQDVRSMTPSQVLGILFLYLVFENIMFKYAGATRRNNIYTVPLQETDLPYSFAKGPERIFSGLQDVWSKYSALNLLPLTTFGTLEYRHMPGHNNIRKTIIWVDMLSRLKIYSYRHPFAEIVNHISTLNTTSQYELFVREVFEELTGYLDLSNLKSDMERAVTMVKTSAISNTYHSSIISVGWEDESILNKTIRTIIGAKEKKAKVVRPPRPLPETFWPNERALTIHFWYEALHPLQKYAANWLADLIGQQDAFVVAKATRSDHLNLGGDIFANTTYETTWPERAEIIRVFRYAPPEFVSYHSRVGAETLDDSPEQFFSEDIYREVTNRENW